MNMGGSNHKIEVETYRNAATVDSAGGYKGLRIHALPGLLHEFMAERVYEHLSKGLSVLDLAAGSGAMAQRLIDAGYRVTATGSVTENFRLHGTVPFFQTPE